MGGGDSGGPFYFSVLPSHNWTFGFGTFCGLGFGFGPWALDFGLWIFTFRFNDLVLSVSLELKDSGFRHSHETMSAMFRRSR